MENGSTWDLKLDAGGRDRGYREAEYEQSLIELFEGLGYEHVYGPDVERSYTNPLYPEELERALRGLNPGKAEGAIQAALGKLRDFGNADLVQENELFTRYLQNGIEVSYREDGEDRNEIVYIVDYGEPENNSFVVANQWSVQEKSLKRADILIFLNGLPVVLMELKSPSREETDTSAAYAQIRNYMREVPSLFIYNCFCVMSDQLTTKAGTLTAKEDRYMEWKTVDGSYENTQHARFDTFFEGIFEKHRFVDILRNFICFSNDGVNRAKILAGYHQYFAVNKAITATREAMKRGDGKGGVFWHTQGSGKSLSMVFYAHRLREELASPTIVVLTDRNDLDGQLFAQFCRCKDFLRQTPVQATGRQHLQTLLRDRVANGIFFSTMQKFEETDGPLSERDDIVVISDEAHRGQYGLREVVDSASGKIKVGFARLVRDSFPNATYIGFTGTPIALKDKDTREVFGDYIDVYDMTQAVEDHATRPVYYESRVLRLKLDPDTLERINREYDRLETEAADPAVISKSKRELARMDAILGNEKTIISLVDDVLEHYETHRAHLLTGKAMIVAYSRPIAMQIYERILAMRPNWKDKVAVVMTDSNQDPETWHAVIGNKQRREELAREFKDDAGPLKIVIVVDMWLTGFDVPSLATMYVYKPMRGHNLMQAIARVNRVFPEKEGGLVVDYVGIAGALKEAMSEYTQRDRKNFGRQEITETARERFLEKLDVCRSLFHGFDYGKFLTGTDLERAKLISDAVNFIVAVDKEKQRADFQKEALLLRQALSLCSSVVEESLRVEAAFFEAVRVILQKMQNAGSGKKISLREINERIGELLKQSVKSDGVINLFEGVSEHLSLFDPKFLDEIAKMRQKNLAVELLRNLLDEQVRIYRRTNVVKSEEFGALLQEVMNRYLNGMLTNEQVIRELLALARQITAAHRGGESLGLKDEELAFYDALSKPQAVKDFYKNEVLIAMARELTDTLRRNKTVDWQKRKRARAQMRMLVLRLLKKYKYPPSEAIGATDTVMEQCELWADNADSEASSSYGRPKEVYDCPEEVVSEAAVPKPDTSAKYD